MGNIIKVEGLRGLSKGITASWSREAIYTTIRLGTYEPCRNYFSGGKSPKDTSFMSKLAAGGVAGFVGSCVSAPADILKIRMQACEKIDSHGLIWHA